MDYKDLKQFLYYMQDKIQECYKTETNQAIKRFLKEIEGSENNG